MHGRARLPGRSRGDYHGPMSTLLVPCLFVALVAASPPDEAAETLALFRKVYARAEQPRERFEAVLELKGMDSVAAAEALLPALEDDDFGVRRAAVEVLSGYRREEVARWLCDGVLRERKLAKRTVLRAGAVEALGGMGQPWAYDACAELLGDKDVSLRLAAIVALGQLRNPAACASLSALAGDADGTLAVAALDALARIGSTEGAQGAVIAALEHADWRVRARAIEAAVGLRLKDAIRPLMLRLEAEDGRLRGDAYAALKTLTLRDFGEQSAPWLAWWERTEAGFVLPDLDKVKAALEEERVKGSRYKTGGKQFLTVQTKSENILFVIDVSGSMDIPFGDPERLKMTGRSYASLQRLSIVKEELIATINDLPETTAFNIVAFATGVKPWKKDPVRATILNKAGATEWVAKLQPLGVKRGGTSFEVSTGMAIEVQSEGATNTYLALMTALGEPVGDDRPRTGGGFVTEPPRSPLDTVFFLTDGEPTVGRTVDMNEIRREVQRVNAYRGVQIHVIYVGEIGGEDFQKLARENRGVFVKIGG